MIGKNFSLETWRTIAVILLILFIFELTFIITLFVVGSLKMQKQTACVNACTNLEGGGFYKYDDVFEICKCIKGDGTIIKTISMR